jgi:hypothetical protein
LVNVLYDAIPLRTVRNFLIRTHMERCERCLARLISRSEVAALLVKPGDLGALETLGQKIDRRAGHALRCPETRPFRLHWEWAAGAATFLVLVAASLWLLRGVRNGGLRADLAPPAERFEIGFINVGGAPAQAFVYQLQGSDIVFVWAGKNP